jgi:uncharacterized protein YodC (DUF2158 family)
VAGLDWRAERRDGTDNGSGNGGAYVVVERMTVKEYERMMSRVCVECEWFDDGVCRSQSFHADEYTSGS